MRDDQNLENPLYVRFRPPSRPILSLFFFFFFFFSPRHVLLPFSESILRTLLSKRASSYAVQNLIFFHGPITYPDSALGYASGHDFLFRMKLGFGHTVLTVDLGVDLGVNLDVDLCRVPFSCVLLCLCLEPPGLVRPADPKD
jgi:hypothetical protein